jgi:hypothetical protein
MTDYIASLQQALREAAAREYPARASSPDPMQRLIGEDAPTERRQRRSSADTVISRRGRRRRHARWLAPALGLATVLVVAAIVLTSGGSRSIVARAYAATSTNGVIVHYIQTLQFRSSSGAPQTVVHDVWASGEQRHLIVTASDLKQSTEEITFNGSEIQNYTSPTDTIYTYRVSARALTRGCGSVGVLLGECGRSDQADPVTALRRLYEAGRLHAAGQSTHGGRHVDVIKGSSDGVRLRALLSPHTFIPIEVQIVRRLVRPAGFAPLQITTTVTDYQRLSLAPRNRQLLLMRGHPDARVVHLCVNGSTCSASRN